MVTHTSRCAGSELASRLFAALLVWCLPVFVHTPPDEPALYFQAVAPALFSRCLPVFVHTPSVGKGPGAPPCTGLLSRIDYITPARLLRSFKVEEGAAVPDNNAQTEIRR